MNIGIKADIKRATRKLNNAAKKQIPFAASKSLNELAFNISRKSLPKKADQVFEGGATSFTKRGFKYIKSTKRKLTSVVYIDDRQGKYMRYQVDGGERKPEKVAILAPTQHSKLNKYGNFTKTTISKMISDKSKYFSGTPKGQTPGADNQGIYERYAKNKKIKLFSMKTGRCLS